MGIPVYFKTLINEYQDDILITKKIDHVEALFLDLNCLIHPCCRGETDESVMIQKVLDGITKLIEYSGVQRLVYLAVDGVAPMGKMKQQRMRRYKSILEKKGQWDTNAISPGTFFMNRLNDSLDKYEYRDIQIITSNSSERGEGEHKILHYLKNNKIDDKIVIYGLDADLIMLSLVSRVNNIYLLRERTEYNIEQTESEYIYLTIDSLKTKIMNQFDNPSDSIIDDYLFICFFLGNDFMNHLPSVSLRYNGYQLLIDAYKKLQDVYQGYFYLIDRESDDLICFTFLKEYLQQLQKVEHQHFMRQQFKREHQYKRLYAQYSSEHLEFRSYLKNKEVTINHIHDFLHNKIDDKYHEMINHLPILYYPEEKKYIQDFYPKKKDDLSKDYLESLVWTTHYYFKECIHWKWSSQYNRAPFIKDLSSYLQKGNRIKITKEDLSCTPEEQLRYILPKESHRVHPYKFSPKSCQLKVDTNLMRYLWECHLDFE